jgi:hypothetical protein
MDARTDSRGRLSVQRHLHVRQEAMQNTTLPESDFRDHATAQSEGLLGGHPTRRLAQGEHSCCVPVPKGFALLRQHEITTLVLTVTFTVVLPLAALFSFTKSIVVGIVLALLSISGVLLLNKVRAAQLTTKLANRDGSLIRKQLFPGFAVSVENADTVEQTKVIVEDMGVCMLDAKRRLLMIEGCAYRYCIRAVDVTELVPVSGTGISGVRIGYRIAEAELRLALCLTDYGPVARVVSAVHPSHYADRLYRQMQSLFQIETHAKTDVEQKCCSATR